MKKGTDQSLTITNQAETERSGSVDLLCRMFVVRFKRAYFWERMNLRLFFVDCVYCCSIKLSIIYQVSALVFSF